MLLLHRLLLWVPERLQSIATATPQKQPQAVKPPKRRRYSRQLKDPEAASNPQTHEQAVCEWQGQVGMPPHWEPISCPQGNRTLLRLTEVAHAAKLAAIKQH